MVESVGSEKQRINMQNDNYTNKKLYLYDLYNFTHKIINTTLTNKDIKHRKQVHKDPKKQK